MNARTIKVMVFALLLIAALLSEGAALRTSYSSAIEKPDTRKADASTYANVIDEFDRVVQKRFHDVVGFGMARIATEKTFLPETREEKAAVDSLKKAKLKVALFLAGRLTLEQEPTRAQFYDYSYYKRAISHPLFLGSRASRRELPERLELFSKAREALTAFGEGKDSIEFTVDKWNVRARPVRATEEQCVKCHKEDYRVVYPPAGGATTEPTRTFINFGDPIGALLYLYSLKQ